MVNTRITLPAFLGSMFLLCGMTTAATFVLTPIDDVFLNGTSSGNKSTNFNGQKLQVLQSPSSGGASLVQFDLSSLAGLTITDAYLRVFQFDTTGNTAAFTADAYFVDYANGSGGFDETVATWNNYGGPTSESLTDGFGDLSIPLNSAAGTYYESVHAIGIPSDLAHIQGRIDQPNTVDQIMAIQLYRQSGSSGNRLFGDKENVYVGDGLAHPVQLVIETVPEPSAALLASSGCLLLAFGRRRFHQG